MHTASNRLINFHSLKFIQSENLETLKVGSSGYYTRYIYHSNAETEKCDDLRWLMKVKVKCLKNLSKFSVMKVSQTRN